MQVGSIWILPLVSTGSTWAHRVLDRVSKIFIHLMSYQINGVLVRFSQVWENTVFTYFKCKFSFLIYSKYPLLSNT